MPLLTRKPSKGRVSTPTVKVPKSKVAPRRGGSIQPLASKPRKPKARY